MPQKPANREQILLENQKLTDELEELREIIRAVKSGEVDALVIQTVTGDKVFTLKSADVTYREVIEDMKEGTALLADDNTVLYCNCSFGNMTKTPINKIIGTNIQNYVAPTHAENFLKLIEQGKTGGGKQVSGIALRASDNTLIQTQVSVNTLHLENEHQTTYLVVTDLTEHMQEDVKRYTGALENEIAQRKKTEETLRATQKQLEEKATEVKLFATRMEKLAADRLIQLKNSERLAAIGQTAAMVGHDIRNPLQSILSELYLAKTEIKTLQRKEVRDSLNESIKSIEEDVGYINKIVADLQDFAKTLKPVNEPVNLRELLEEFKTVEAIPENVDFSISVSQDLPLFMADPAMIKRIMYNLLQNSVQAMPKGGKLEVTAQKTGNNIVIAVKDTGVGISKEVRAKIFTPLFTTKAKGQGFGLPVVKRMTEAQGGTVTFESQEGKGTTFTINLPFTPTKQ